MSILAVVAIAQWGVAFGFFALGAVSVRVRRWTLVSLGWFLSVDYLLRGLRNWDRIRPLPAGPDWVSSPTFVLVRTLVIGILLFGIVMELVIREWGRKHD